MGGISPLLVALVVSFTRTSGSVARFLGGSLCNQLGRISYIIYIVQSPLWHYWQGLTDVLRGGSSHLAVAAWQFFIFLPVLIFIAFGLEHAVELPARRWLSRRNGTRWLALWPARRTTATGERPLAS
jgi:peptidoglycan/LPS O-acetylase OafA/YrhL